MNFIIPLRFLASLRHRLLYVEMAALGAFGLTVSAELTSGVYQTDPGSTVVETGDYVYYPDNRRVVPLTATLSFDLAGTTPSLTAVIHDAVLEGGSDYGKRMLEGREQPFELTVRSWSGTRHPDGSYQFAGSYLVDIRPSVTEYRFSWRFSSGPDGSVWWNGSTYWVGGHGWLVEITDVQLVPEPNALGLLGLSSALFWAARHRRGVSQ